MDKQNQTNQKTEQIVAPVAVAVLTTTTEKPVQSPDPIIRTTARFYETDGNSARGPVFRVEVDIPSLPGVIMEASIFADKDVRGAVTGYRVTMPGSNKNNNYAGVVRSAPMYVTRNDGVIIPQGGTKDPRGKQFEQNWNAVILTALHAYQKTDNPTQSITL